MSVDSPPAPGSAPEVQSPSLVGQILDGDASEAFFGDRWRMSRDVLADGAEEYLKRLSFD